MRNLLLAVVLAATACTHAAPPPVAPVAAAPDPHLAAQREIAIARLDAYRRAGVFPTDDAGMPLSAFHDRAGHPCPMAFLIEESGHRDLVADVVRTNNRLKLAAVRTGPLMDWMLESGLTQEEVAMVQGALDISEYDRPTVELFARAINAHVAVEKKLAAIERRLSRDTQTSLAIAQQRAHAAVAVR